MVDSTHHQLHSRHARSLRMNKLWTRTGYGIVFVYANTFNQYELRNIKSAAAEIRKHSCIPVVLFSQSQWNGESGRYPHYVFIEKNSAVGCGQSAVGIQGGVQFLTLSPDPRCLTVTTIMHEMIHALGAEHEQSRPDRNQYIQIHNPNIQHGYQNVFNVAYGTTAYGPYDFDSVMHYGKYAFSHSPNNLPTLSSRIPGYFVPAYENAHLSYWDKRKINYEDEHFRKLEQYPGI
ncbi:Astacin-like metalloendopeptidase [Orchesella cincta]|uniref:Metalloendopeptidase n=1 Tax=Orchesella cincta TaxID=48709 RepID=A0A1D2N7Q7_ORCCI|nr:Astacin-like metalloendopeptidase [Orchesella cincta]